MARPPANTKETERELALFRAEKLNELGNVEWSQSHYSEAQKCYQEALNIFRAHGDRSGECKALGALGTAFQRQGLLDQAIECHTASIAIAQDIGNKRTQSFQLGNLGNIHQRQGQLDRAVELYNQALSISRDIGDRRNESSQLGNLGVVYEAIGQFSQALEHHNQSLIISRETGDKRSEGIQMGNLGDLLMRLNRWEEADEAFCLAISICDAVLPAAAGAFRGSLALLRAQQGHLDQALRLLQEGEPLVQPELNEFGKFLCKKSQVCHSAGDTPGALSAFEQAKAIAHKLGLSDESEVNQRIADLTALLG